MDYWARPPERREQLVMFPARLDEAVPAEHPVRRLNEILSRVDWSHWEQRYDLTRGQPPLHPRVLAGVWLYGLLTRIRSSRALEDALRVRLDFRWLAEGRVIDHTTLSEFRRKHPELLRNLFIQIGLLARELGFIGLQQLSFDGTRVRANSRRSGTRTPPELRDALSSQTTTSKSGATTTRLAKDAFVYDTEHDLYRCPQGQTLTLKATSTEKLVGGNQVRSPSRTRRPVRPVPCGRGA